MEVKQYDIIIIGAGSGGLNVAGFFSRLKLRVLLVDKSDEHIGGDCLNTGCIPSKALIHVANEIHTARALKRFLQGKNNSTDNSQDNSDIDIRKVMEYVKSKQDIIRENENPEYLKNKGIDYISGEAKFVSKNTVSVNETHYTAKNIVLATGSRPRPLSIENDKSLPEYTNETIFTLDFLPKHFVFIGGGPITCELGQAFSRLGAHVTILNTSEHILGKEVQETATLIEEKFKEEGIVIINNAHVQKIYDKKIYYTVTGTEGELSLEADALFLGIGRLLNIENLDIEKAGIKTNETKTALLVDDYLRTTNKHVYVAGDVAGNYQFTHAAEMHTKVIIGNMLSPIKKKFDAKNIAWVTYTTPEIATFGIPEKQAIDDNYEVIVKHFNHDDRAIVDEHTAGFIKVYVNKKGQILGGTMVADNAGELSQELVLLMSTKATLDDLFNKVYPYPTAGRINKQLAGDWVGRKLTKNTINLLRFLYKVT